MEEFLGGIGSGVVTFILLSAAVRALPEPYKDSRKTKDRVYLWFYNFAHGVLSNYDKVIRKNKGAL